MSATEKIFGEARTMEFADLGRTAIHVQVDYIESTSDVNVNRV